MNLKLKRIDYFTDGIFGELSDDKGHKIASTLEHAYDSGHGGGSYKPKLPNGTYNCVRGMHQLHDSKPFETFEITNVPGHKGILLHIGNFNKDSEGCVLLGTEQTNTGKFHMIAHSKAAFQRFMDLQKGVDKFTLTVT